MRLINSELTKLYREMKELNDSASATEMSSTHFNVIRRIYWGLYSFYEEKPSLGPIPLPETVTLN